VKGKAHHIPRRYATAFRFGQIIYYNSARLFCDACILYRAEAYPSAYALAILGYEELGKLEMFDHVVSEAVLNEGSRRLEDKWMQHLFSRSMFYSHRNKQAWGMHQGAKKGSKPQVERLIYSDTLDHHKQDAIYVGFRDGRIQLPDRFRATHAYRQLTYLLRGLERIADLPFLELFEESNRVSRGYSEPTLAALRKEFSQLRAPSRRRKRIPTR
jgi:AbiV family abortive infection protein